MYFKNERGNMNFLQGLGDYTNILIYTYNLSIYIYIYIYIYI